MIVAPGKSEKMDWSELLSSVSELISREEKEKLLITLKMLVRQSLQLDSRKNITGDGISDLASLLTFQEHLIECTSSSLPEDVWVEIWCETLKLLRNICVELPGNQLHVINHPHLLQRAAQLVMKFTTLSTPPISMVAMQLMGNVCVGQPTGRQVVWSTSFPLVFRSIFAGPSSSWGVSCMLLHYSSLEQVNYKNQLCAEAPDIVASVISCLASSSPDTREWSGHLISSLLSSLPLAHLWTCCPPNSLHKLLLLRFLLPSTTSQAHSECPAPPTITMETRSLPAENFTFCTSIFCDMTRRLCQDEDSLLREAHDFTVTGECAESAVLQEGGEDKDRGQYDVPTDFIAVRSCHACLQLLCGRTQDHAQPMLESSRKLTEASLGLLKQLCLLDGSLSSSRNLSNLRSCGPQQTGQVLHPLYGFKRDLVRLLGNLLYESRSVQDELRESGGMTVLLNLCTLDHRNPYIAQWTVFAIRNLCEGNPANQQLIAGLRAQGACPLDEEMLAASGGEVVIGDDGRVKIKSRSR